MKFQKDHEAHSKELERFIGKIIRVSISVPSSIAYLKALRHAFYSSINDWADFNDNCLFELDL